MEPDSSLIPYITCHRCGNQKSNTVRIFFSSCKHLFCKSCLQKSGRKCGTCNVPARFIEVGPSMSPNVRAYFLPCQSSGSCNEALFQIEHQNIFLSQRRDLPGKYEVMKKMVRYQMNQANAFKRRLLEEQNLIRRLDAAIAEKNSINHRGVAKPFSPSSSLNRSLGSLSSGTADLSRSSGYESKMDNESFFEPEAPRFISQERSPVIPMTPGRSSNPSKHNEFGRDYVAHQSHSSISNQQQRHTAKPNIQSNMENRKFQQTRVNNESYFGPENSRSIPVEPMTPAQSFFSLKQKKIGRDNVAQQPHTSVSNQQQCHTVKPNIQSNMERRKFEQTTAQQLFAVNQHKFPFPKGKLLPSKEKRNSEQISNDASKANPSSTITKSKFSSFAFNMKRF